MLKQGDKLIFKPSDSRVKPYETEVISVGRKWAQLSYGYRADKETGVVDGGQYTSPGKVWTEADLANDDYRRIQWMAIKQGATGWRPPNHLSNEKLDLIASLLSSHEGQLEERSDTTTAETISASLTPKEATE